MSDVREQMINVMASSCYGTTNAECTDAILERFQVTPKLAVDDETLGAFMQGLNLGIDGWQYPKYRGTIGRRLRNRLLDAGLEIVRVGE
jgi:hypothetical protein